MAGLMKFVGAFLGKRQPPRLILRGFVGVELTRSDKGDGLIVKCVLAKSPADQAGLKVGDRVTHFQGEEVTTLDEVAPLAVKLRAGKTARFTVTRKGETHKIVVTVGEGL